MKSIRSEDVKKAVEEVLFVLKKYLITNNDTMNIMISLKNCGYWISTLASTSISTSWIKSDSVCNEYESRNK